MSRRLALGKILPEAEEPRPPFKDGAAPSLPEKPSLVKGCLCRPKGRFGPGKFFAASAQSIALREYVW